MEEAARALVQDIMLGKLSAEEILRKHIRASIGGDSVVTHRQQTDMLALAAQIVGVPRLAEAQVWREEVDEEVLAMLRRGIDSMGRGA